MMCTKRIEWICTKAEAAEEPEEGAEGTAEGGGAAAEKPSKD